MKRTLLAMGILLSSGIACAGEGAAWDYSGDTGPEQWVKLSPEYSSCSGSHQSPINLSSFVDGKLEPIKFNYTSGSASIINNGHTVQVNMLPGNTITVDGIEFELKQFHFHVPSENLINGESFPMEGHLVHADKAGHLAVVAVMFTQGATNNVLGKAWAQMPQLGETLPMPADISALDILPENHAYYRFEGSLTTPPCSEGVRWLVMKQPVYASEEQITQFLHVMHHHNNRPVQPVNDRVVLQ